MSRIRETIHSEVFGEGPDVVFVHGWGMHSGVWRAFAKHFAKDFRVTLLDLPGHGRSGMIADYSLSGVAQALATKAPARAHWVGWSLGAKVSLQWAALQPERVASLTLLAGNARFSRSEDWPCGMDLSLLSRFAEDLIVDYQRTLIQFLGLQTWGLEHQRDVLKCLKESVFECAEPEAAALQAGLDILRTADLRAELTRLQLPLLLLLGSRDRLAPPAAGEAMSKLAVNCEWHVLEGAAHTPFHSHAEQCSALLAEFWSRCQASERQD